MRYLIAALLILGGLTSSVHSHASTTADAPKLSAFALPLTGNRIDDETLRILNQLLTRHLQAIENYSFITNEDVENMVGFEAKRRILDCDAESCLPEIGGALGVDHLLKGSLGRLGGDLIVSFTLIDVADAKVLKRSNIKIPDREGLYDDAIRDTIYQVFGKSSSAGHSQNQEARMPRDSSEGSSLFPTLMMGVGAAILGGGVYFGLEAQAAHDSATRKAVGGQSAIESGQESQMTANLLYGTGALLAATGLTLWFLDEPSDDATMDAPSLQTKVAIFPSPDMVFISLSFEH